MDVRVLQELIECSVCFELMGPNSKVLPCQHTFCQSCLDSIVRTRGELRCPECRVLVTIPIVDLPTNILLIRLLDSLKTAGGSTSTSITETADAEASTELPLGATSTGLLPCARALYDYDAQEPGDLSFKKGDRVILRKRIDTNWLLGEAAGRVGFFPESYVQVITQLPAIENSLPRGRALYDFELSQDEEDCLKLRKNDVVSIIRRVDSNWLEGQLGDKIGIFPISYVKLNGAAKNLLKGVNAGAAAVSSRQVPPTPSSDVVPCVPTGATGDAGAEQILSRQLFIENQPSSESFASENSAVSRLNTRCMQDRNSPKRHSATSLSTASVPCDTVTAHLHRHSMEIPRTEIMPLAGMTQATCPSLPSRNQGSQSGPALQKPTGSGGINTQLIPIHVAMFNYKPQRDDELELEKGKLYKVADMCRDGWYKGVSLTNNQSGVFPGNYVQSVISLPKAGSEQRGVLSPRAPISPPPTERLLAVHADTKPPRMPEEGAIVPAATELAPSLPQLDVKTEKGSIRVCSPHRHPTSVGVSGAGGSAVHGAVAVHGHHGRATSMPMVASVTTGVPVATHRNDSVSKNRRKAGSLDSALDDQAKPSSASSESSRSLQSTGKLIPCQRYRCIVPYPAQCDAETELLVGDVVLVHKKRNDGWFKGTHQRTGKCGLFPSSFLEKC